jgi:hypothetical protein
VNDLVPLPPHRTAALVWPAVDRVFRGVLATTLDRGGTELCQRYGGPAAIGFLVDFRTRLAAPGGTISGAGLAALIRYGDPAECQRVLDKQVAHGMIHRQPDGGIVATERGRAFLTELTDLHAEVTREIWAGHPEGVRRLAGTLGRLLHAALDEGPAPDGAFGELAPPYEPDGTPPGVLLLGRLGALRHHRADAHAEAWRAAGHTARTIVELTSGPERVAIELETDRRAAGPYAVLSAPERLRLLADLAALPG